MRRQKSFLNTLLACILIFFLAGTLQAQNIGIIPKVSTSGIGLDIGYRIAPKFLLKAGYDNFEFAFDANVESELSLDVNSPHVKHQHKNI